MEDSKGAPWVARLPWYWAVGISLVTAGVYPIIIGIYLSVWVRSKRRAGIAVFGYGTIMVLAIIEILATALNLKPPISEGIDTVGFTLWVVSSFVLRRELQLQFAWPDGSLPEMSILWTALFSVFYLNYQVWSRSDTA